MDSERGALSESASRYREQRSSRKISAGSLFRAQRRCWGKRSAMLAFEWTSLFALDPGEKTRPCGLSQPNAASRDGIAARCPKTGKRAPEAHDAWQGSPG